MSFLSRRFADLTGRAIGNWFRIKELAGRDRSGAPVWRVICQQCKCAQTFPHMKLTNALGSGQADVLRCQNTACAGSHIAHARTETLVDVRRAEREAQRQAELVAKQEQERVAKKAAEEAALRAERQRWLRVANHQVSIGVPLSQVLTFQTWMCSGAHWREEIVKRVNEYEQSA